MGTSWKPKSIEQTHLFKAMKQRGFKTYSEFHQWSIHHREAFWEDFLKKMQLSFKKAPLKIVDLEKGVQKPHWLPEAQWNIVDSCFLAEPKNPALYFQKEGGSIETLTYGELKKRVNQVSNGLIAHGFQSGDVLAIDLPMNIESVIAYLGTIQAGMAVASIADSFAAPEISIRLQISKAKGIFTQNFIERGGKKIPLFQRVKEAKAPRAIVIDESAGELRGGDLSWNQLIEGQSDTFESIACDSETSANILFSSGTTGEPKAIPWTHTTPIKCAMDAYYHHDIHPEDILAWPTNLGWMMGPWLIFAALLNRASFALYGGAPLGRDFGEFVQNSQVTMLGVVPSLVKTWMHTQCMEGLDWSAMKCLSSTGECSNPEEMSYLMDLAGNRPVIEYCGGTEIGGGYLTGTLVQEACPSSFTTPALGLNFYILDENGNETEEGEVFLVPPSIGLSNTLLNRNHDEVYYAGTPQGPNGEPLRRHGDQVQKTNKGYRALGRADDTMNLGGIKTSSAEIERSLNKLEGIKETAAIAVPPPGGGPSLLVIYTVLLQDSSSKELREKFQTAIKNDLNPLFRVHDAVVVESLPRTASNKVMRRVLRKKYLESHA